MVSTNGFHGSLYFTKWTRIESKFQKQTHFPGSWLLTFYNNCIIILSSSWKHAQSSLLPFTQQQQQRALVPLWLQNGIYKVKWGFEIGLHVSDISIHLFSTPALSWQCQGLRQDLMPAVFGWRQGAPKTTLSQLKPPKKYPPCTGRTCKHFAHTQFSIWYNGKKNRKVAIKLSFREGAVLCNKTWMKMLQILEFICKRISWRLRWH